MMKITDFIEILLYFTVLIGVSPFLGTFMYKIFEGKKTFLTSITGPVEKTIFALGGIKPEHEMDWKEYLFSMLIFNLIGFIFLFLVLLLQGILPLNPYGIKNMTPDLAFNTAVSFVTNTNWQSYSGENGVSYFTQMIGLTVQNFLSAATGIAVFLALARGFIRKNTYGLGNFWVDMTRSVIYVLLPLGIIFAVIFVSQGVVQTFSNYTEVTTIEGAKQVIPLGPAASQIAIKQLGTNGGGFFGTNSAHPFENPNPVSNFFEMLLILLIPSSLVFTFGRMTGSMKQAAVIYAAMMIILISGLSVMLYSEYSYNPVAGTHGFMEGKEVRFGITNSVLWASATSAASNGSVNAMHDSLSPLSGMIAMLNIMLGEIIFGGVGSGLYGILMFVILTVFIAGLMVGRTPEYLGKKIEKKEIQMSMLAVIAPNFIILLFTAISLVLTVGLSSILNKGPHGFSEVLYAFTSAAGNNGSAFAGLNTDTVYYNILQGIAMLAGRYMVIIPVMVIAGSLSGKKIIPESGGTFRTDTRLFVFLLVSIILIIGALTHFPALTLGPILEHLLMLRGITF
jgi:potassium-transporting ATPase potassium-binding subunit